MSPKSDSKFKGKYLRQLPSVGKLMEHPELEQMSGEFPRIFIIDAINEVINSRKTRILNSEHEDQIIDIDLSTQSIIDAVCTLAAEKSRMTQRRAINATGDVLNISLGKAPLNKAAQRALQDVASGYSTLTVDADGDRNIHVQHLLSKLTEAEAALVVNNNAAAVMLILNTIADGKEVIVSRGQLIENDGFRLPEIIARSGAEMISVGATNRTRARDYRNAITENTGSILKVYKSGYRVTGFSEDVSIRELADMGKEHSIPVIDDIGGGCIIDLTQYGLPKEPPAFLSIRAGADIVCFSGDELLGGPQSGIIIGGEEYVSMMKKNPLYRVLRATKLTIAALEATLRSYLNTDEIMQTNSVFRILSRSPEEIEFMARLLVDSLVREMDGLVAVEIMDGCSQISSISSNPKKFPTKLVSIRPMEISAEEVNRRLRERFVPIFAVAIADSLIMDLRTVHNDELDEMVSALVECCR